MRNPHQLEGAMEQLRVSVKSEPKAVAGAIAAIIRSGQTVEMNAIGAGAVNQAVKSICVARGYLEPEELDIVTLPSFVQLDVDGEERTSIRFEIRKTERQRQTGFEEAQKSDE